MTNETPTPRTDAVYAAIPDYDAAYYAQNLMKLCRNLERELSAARAELEKLRGGGWQPIETAPKGELIDIWIQNGDGSGVRWTDCYHDAICNEWRTSRPSGHLVFVSARHVTHWRPAPAAPSGGESET